jgi:hypothetical protein
MFDIFDNNDSYDFDNAVGAIFFLNLLYIFFYMNNLFIYIIYLKVYLKVINYLNEDILTYYRSIN